MPRRRGLGRTLREIFTAEGRAQRAVEDAAAEVQREDAMRALQEGVQRTIPVETLRERPSQERLPSAMNTVAVWPPYVMVVSGTPGRVEQAPLTLTNSRQMPNDLAPSTPLRAPRRPIRITQDATGRQRVEFPDQEAATPTTASSTPTAAPTVPLAWDDPTIKRVRRVVIEDE